jgi:hypothetical protein
MCWDMTHTCTCHTHACLYTYTTHMPVYPHMYTCTHVTRASTTPWHSCTCTRHLHITMYVHTRQHTTHAGMSGHTHHVYMYTHLLPVFYFPIWELVLFPTYLFLFARFPVIMYSTSVVEFITNCTVIQSHDLQTYQCPIMSLLRTCWSAPILHQEPRCCPGTGFHLEILFWCPII